MSKREELVQARDRVHQASEVYAGIQEDFSEELVEDGVVSMRVSAEVGSTPPSVRIEMPGPDVFYVESATEAQFIVNKLHEFYGVKPKEPTND
jgi:hypothetical protein